MALLHECYAMSESLVSELSEGHARGGMTEEVRWRFARDETGGHQEGWGIFSALLGCEKFTHTGASHAQPKHNPQRRDHAPSSQRD